MLQEMMFKFKFYKEKYYRSEYYRKHSANVEMIIYIIYLIAYMVIMLSTVYPAWVDKGTANYQITESAIEIEAGDWYSVIIKGYIDNGEERDKFRFETNSELISKDQIGASSDETVIVESVQTYNRDTAGRAIIIGLIFGFGYWGPVIIGIRISNLIYDIKQKRKEKSG